MSNSSLFAEWSVYLHSGDGLSVYDKFAFLESVMLKVALKESESPLGLFGFVGELKAFVSNTPEGGKSVFSLSVRSAESLLSQLNGLLELSNASIALQDICEKAKSKTGIDVDVMEAAIASVISGRARGVGERASCERILLAAHLNPYSNTRIDVIIAAANEYAAVLAKSQSAIKAENSC